MYLTDFIEKFKTRLVLKYPQTEISSLLSILLECKLNLGLSQAYINKDITIPHTEIDNFETILEGLENYQPIQYLLVEAWFYDLKLKVTPDTLIPRNETEELVRLIINTHKNTPINILDIGTGSGCIAISLAKNLPSAKVYAIDISEEAIAVASENAKTHHVDIQFIHKNILEQGISLNETFDVIVSNPPYVTESDKKAMFPNVLENEPHLALFVSDENPFTFYEAISHFASNHLSTKGKLYFEINERFPTQIEDIMKKHGFHRCISHIDLYDKYRFTEGIKNG
ncbi:peptide chain release factor N(5)-glutamine methyltransferase [Bacteroidales bacterium]|nr:peptide chain release factor N(5)-glutamine methyltransferase [Bacteroidales bacterium]